MNSLRNPWLTQLIFGVHMSLAIFWSTIGSHPQLFAAPVKVTSGHSAVPDWWAERNVIDPNVDEVNHGVLNTGQLRWMSRQAGAELNAVLQGSEAPSFVHPQPDTVVLGANAEAFAPVNLGQLKAMAKPFYDSINALHSVHGPAFLSDSLDRSEVPSANRSTASSSQSVPPLNYITGGVYPWSLSGPVPDNHAPALVGQLKAMFSINFAADAVVAGEVPDGLPDLFELALIKHHPDFQPGGQFAGVSDISNISWQAGDSEISVTLPGATGPVGLSGILAPFPELAAANASVSSLLQQHQPVGSLKGSLSVSGDGSASYSIPIDVPKGTGGLEPSVNLSYSSNSGNGIAGLGWQLTGLQQIVRGKPDLRVDGFVDGIDFDADDRFFFQGERLICVAGNYGEAGSVYRTEMDSYARITAHGQTSPNGGPQSWTVETKAGLKITFGNRADSIVKNGNNVVSWMVERVEDTVGNYYEAFYGRSSNADPKEVKNLSVSRIDYTGNDRASPPLLSYASVVFDYENRQDARVFFVAGVKHSFDRRLKTVRVTTGSFENHRYELSYISSEQTGRSLLSEVSQVGADGSIVPPTKFTWQTNRHSDPKWAEFKVPNGVSFGEDAPDSEIILTQGDQQKVRLRGHAWKTFPLTCQTHSDSLLEFEYRSVRRPGNAAIGLFSSTSVYDLESMAQLDPIDPVTALSFDYNPGLPGAWQRFVVPIGSKITGHIIKLGLVNFIGPNDDPNGESEFRGIKVYRTGDNPENFNSANFGQTKSSPQIVSSDLTDRGWVFHDFDGDGYQDGYRGDYTGRFNYGGGKQWLSSLDTTLKGDADGFSVVSDPGAAHKTATTIGDTLNHAEGLRNGYLLPFVDIDGDGAVEACFPHDLRIRHTYKTYYKQGPRGQPGSSVTEVDTYNKNGYGFVSRKSGEWQELEDYRLPFQLESVNNMQRFWTMQFNDLDGDSYPDCIMDPAHGIVLGVPGTAGPGRVFLNKVNSGEGWKQHSNWDIPIRLNKDRQDTTLLDVNDDGLPDVLQYTHNVINRVYLNNGGRTTGSAWENLGNQSPFHLPLALTNSADQDIGTLIHRS